MTLHLKKFFGKTLASLAVAALVVSAVPALGSEVPTAEAAAITTIDSGADFYSAVEANPSGSFRLANDIDLSGLVTSGTTTFKGTLDGNGYTISGINTNSVTSYGLFTKLDGATVQNLTLELDGHITKSVSYKGVLAGTAKDSVITGVTVNGHAYTIAGSAYVGGLVGSIYGDSTVTNNHVSNLIVSGSSYAIGGLVGIAYQSGVTLSKNSVDNVDVSGLSYVGGFAGKLHSYSQTLKNSAVNSTVTAKSSYAGGFAGEIQTSAYVQNSYAQNNVVAKSYAGSFAGEISNGNITNTYGAGKVSADKYAGGYAGKISLKAVSGTNYYNSNLTSGLAAVGTGTADNITALGNAAMKKQAKYTGWNFNSIWTIDETVSFPTLQ